MFKLSQVVCLIVASVVPVVPFGERDAPAGKKLKPTAVFAGTHSQIKKETFTQITTAESWKSVWENHRGKHNDRRFTESEQELEIDFETHYIVAIFTGSGDWCQVTPRMRGETVVIGFEARVNCIEGGPLGAISTEQQKWEEAKESATAPYAFVVLAKPVKAVIVEQAIREDRSNPAVWKPRVTFPVLNVNK